MAADFSSLVRDVLEAKANELWDVSKFLWGNPETALRETKAHDMLCEFLERQDFNVSRRHYMDTAFRAEYGAPGGTNGPTVALMAEYDALPDIGHGCGHNLVSQSVLGAAVAVKEVMNKVTNLSGKIVVLGTPAEEDNVGKITLLEKGAFDDISVAMTAHPGAQDVLKTAFSASQKLTVTYSGKAAHAAVCPWDGVNAADAAVSAYLSLAMLRHRISDTSRILALIEDCGQYPNIITESSRLVCHVLTPDPEEELDALQARAERCLCAAAHATGCKATIARGRRCRLFAHNDALVRAYRSHGKKLGIHFVDMDLTHVVPTGGASDAANVSHEVPTLLPEFAIGSVQESHTREFAQAAGSESAQAPTRRASQMLALTALDVFADPQLLPRARKDLAEWKAARRSPCTCPTMAGSGSKAV
ncbi:xaa-Arg dipeptidase-like [Dermacentor variabilis]|uniref:xaa-Arg dipeptidase-like n=1 Tax=Dermacentor variabilis TaxID=34621 RepID=UPI003F5B22F7